MSSTDHLSELEALRSQVADLSRELAEREQLMSAERYHLEEMKQDFREQTQLLRAIIEGPAAETGEEFFAALVTHLTSALHVQYAVIGEVSEGLPKKMRTLAVSAGGTLVGNFEYELAHTPCATALTGTFVCFDRDVQGAFPLFQRLADLGAESYCAVPLRAKGGTVMGLLLVMDTRPLQQVDDLQSLLGVLAPRIGAEFERRRAEREHAQALADLFNVTETVPDILFTLDTQGNMVKWNRRVVDVTGYSPEELLNKPALAFVPPEEQTRTAAAIQRAFTEGYAELEGLLLTKDLRIIPYHWTGALLKNAHGEPIGITGVGRDVSGKKLVEEELKQQQRHLVDAQGLAHLGSWNWEVDTGEVKWSDELFRIFGYEPGAIAITYDRFMTSLHPDDQARVLATIDDVHRGTCPYDIEYRIVRPDGEVRFIYARADVHRDATGHPLSMAGTVLDITERKQAEEKLRLSEQRQELALSGANLGLWDWDVPSGTALFDVRWCSMIGYAVDELNPHVDTWRSLLHQEDAPIIQAILESHLKNETPDYEAEFRIRHKAGHWIWILARGRVVERDHAGAPLRMAGTHMDITDRKRAEEALIHNERQLRTVLDALPVGVWFTDQSGKPVLFNPAAKQIWSGIKQVGIETAADDAGWWEAIGPSDAFHRWALSQSLTKGVSSLNETLDLEGLDGRIKTIRNTTVPVQDEAGVILGAIVLNEDFTALRQMQGALKLTQSSVDHAVEGFLWADSDARILNVNDAACRMLEYTRDELTTMTVHDIDPNFPQELWANHWEELRRKGSMTFESKHWSKTGRVLDTEVTVTCLDYEGRQYSCAIMRDIGERKRADVALRASEERYRSLYDETPIMYFTLATDGTVRSVNRFGADQLGYQVEEVIGHSVLDICHEDDKEMVAARLDECFGTPGTVREWEFRKVRKDGRIIWVWETARVGQSSTGEAIVLVTCEDITDRKRMEDVLRERERDLRAAVEERERISQDLHDGILQSLFAVGLALESAKSRMSTRTRKTSGAPVDQAIGQLNRVMREIRNFIAGLGSDLLKGKNLPAALQQMLESLTQTHATRVRLAVDDRAAQGLSAEQSLHLLLVIQEAVSNCIRHGGAQEATVSLKMLKQGVRLSIRDNGSGFNPKVVRRTGHGLTNMAVRAQKIGGRFSVFSKINEGTRVVVDLPKEVALDFR